MNKMLNFLKRFIAFLCSFVLTLSLMPNVYAASGTLRPIGNQHIGYGRMLQYVDVYNQPNGTIIGSMPNGEGFTILDDMRRADRWVEVEYSTYKGEKRGFINAAETSFRVDQRTMPATVNATTSVWFGNNSDNYQIMGTVYTGETVVILATPTSSGGFWAHIEYNTTAGRKRGYVPLPNLTPMYADGGYAAYDQLSYVDRSIFVSGTHTVYAGPTTSYAVLETIVDKWVYYDNTIVASGSLRKIFYYPVNGGKMKIGYIVV